MYWKIIRLYLLGAGQLIFLPVNMLNDKPFHIWRFHDPYFTCMCLQISKIVHVYEDFPVTVLSAVLFVRLIHPFSAEQAALVSLLMIKYNINCWYRLCSVIRWGRTTGYFLTSTSSGYQSFDLWLPPAEPVTKLLRLYSLTCERFSVRRSSSLWILTVFLLFWLQPRWAHTPTHSLYQLSANVTTTVGLISQG